MDSKAFLLCLLKRLPYMLIIGLTGAIIGSGLYLLIASYRNRVPVYSQVTEYYIDFAEGRYEARDYYNAYTWNDVMTIDEIMDVTMQTLGAAYDKNTVMDMITADILSDVRYLTITVKGEDASMVEAVSAATQVSLAAFGGSKDEFDSIALVKDEGVKPVKNPMFTWRAAFLGFLIAECCAVFVFCVRFGLGESFYSKEQLRQRLGLPVLGIWYAGERTDCMQENMTRAALETLAGEDVAFINVTDKDYAGDFLGQYEQSARGVLRARTAGYTQVRESEQAVLVIPFGVPCSHRAEDIVCELQRRGCRIAGVLLTEADRRWVRAYYADKGAE